MIHWLGISPLPGLSASRMMGSGAVTSQHHPSMNEQLISSIDYLSKCAKCFLHEYFAKMRCTATYVSLTSLPLAFSLTVLVTAIVAKLRSTPASHMKTPFKFGNVVLAARTTLPALFGGQFLHPFCLFVLSTELARMCFRPTETASQPSTVLTVTVISMNV